MNSGCCGHHEKCLKIKSSSAKLKAPHPFFFFFLSIADILVCVVPTLIMNQVYVSQSYGEVSDRKSPKIKTSLAKWKASTGLKRN